MTKHHTRKNKKHIKRKQIIVKKPTIVTNKRNKRKKINYRKKTNKRSYKMKGGNAKNTLTPSPVMNGWYNLMDTPSSVSMTLDGVEVPKNMTSDPTQGLVIDYNL